MQRVIVIGWLVSAVCGCVANGANSELDPVQQTAALAGFEEAEGTWSGDVEITTQAQADALGCITRICGSLTVRPAEATITLPHLQEVTGDVRIEVEPTAAGSFMAAEHVALPALSQLGGSLSFHHLNGDYGAAVDLELPQLATVPGNLELVLSSFNGHNVGLAGLTRVNGDVSITARGDFYAQDLLAALTRVDGSVHVKTNAGSSGGVLRALQSVGGDLELDSLSRQNDLCLAALQDVAGDFRVLYSYWGPGQYPALAHVGGTFLVQSVPNLDPWPRGALAGSASLTIGALALRQTNFPFFPLTAGTRVAACGAITVEDNAHLCGTSVDDFVNAQIAAGWTGALSVSGNSGTCAP